MGDHDAPDSREAVLTSPGSADKDAQIAALQARVAELEQGLALHSGDMSLYLRAILDNSPAVIFIKDRDFKYVLVNRRYEEMSQLSEETIKGKTDYELFPAHIADGV